jgi:hypothetical protein
MKAMKALLQTHDHDKIALFASACRDPQLYLMAAQFLQARPWWLERLRRHVPLFSTCFLQVRASMLVVFARAAEYAATPASVSAETATAGS